MTEIKRCTKCGQEKALTEFYKHNQKKDGLHPSCKACVKAQQAEYVSAHLDKIMARNKRYYDTHRDDLLVYKINYRNARIDDVREHERAYQKSHPEVFNDISRRHRARKAGAVGTGYTTAAMIQARRDVWGDRCYICGAPAEQIDHVKPIAKGGAHLPCNLRPICKPCNSRKRDKWPYEPAMQLGNLP